MKVDRYGMVVNQHESAVIKSQNNSTGLDQLAPRDSLRIAAMATWRRVEE
jgi:hypothetical protein